MKQLDQNIFAQYKFVKIFVQIITYITWYIKKNLSIYLITNCDMIISHGDTCDYGLQEPKDFISSEGASVMNWYMNYQ